MKTLTNEDIRKEHAEADERVNRKYPKGRPQRCACPICAAWHPIDTAPKDGRLIELRSSKLPATHVMGWDSTRGLWVGKAFTPMGSVRTFWDETEVKIEEWRTIYDRAGE